MTAGVVSNVDTGRAADLRGRPRRRGAFGSTGAKAGLDAFVPSRQLKHKLASFEGLSVTNSMLSLSWLHREQNLEAVSGITEGGGRVSKELVAESVCQKKSARNRLRTGANGSSELQPRNDVELGED